MIEPTDEMVRAYVDAWKDRLFKPPQDSDRPAVRAGLTAVLAIVERDRDSTTVGQAAVTAKLYSLAVLDEVSTAVGKLTVELADIRRRYERELSTGPDQFRNLLAMAERLRAEAGESPAGETREGLTRD